MPLARVSDLFIRKSNGQYSPLVAGKANVTALGNGPDWISGDKCTVRLHFCDDPTTPQGALTAGAINAGDQIVLAGKAATDLDAVSALFSATGFIEGSADGEYYYDATLDLGAVNLASAIAATGNNQLRCMVDVEIQNSTNTARITYQFPVTVRQEAYLGTEGFDTGDPLYPSPAGIPVFAAGITGLTGGGSTKLDGMDTSVMSTGSVVMLAIALSLSGWQLVAGTDAEDVAGGIVRPDDFHATDNARVFKRVF